MVWGNSVAPNGMETGFPQKGSAFCGMSAHVGADAHIGLRGGEKIPLRQCVGCREMKPKKELIRVVKSPEGEVSLDFKGKKPGRGAYVCPDAECLRRARKSRALERAFSAAMPDGVYDALEAQMREGGDG